MVSAGAPFAAQPSASLRERKKLATRRLLRRTALDLIAERGLANVTVEDIAQAADVSPRTFFNYFPSKEAALFGGGPERCSVLRERVATHAPGRPALDALRAVMGEDIQAVAGEFLALGGGDPADWVRRLKAARADPHVRAAQAAQMAVLEHAVIEGLAERLRADPETDPYPGVLAAVAIGAVRACLAFWAASGGTADLGQLIDLAFRALGDGLPQDAALRQIATDRKDRH